MLESQSLVVQCSPTAMGFYKARSWCKQESGNILEAGTLLGAPPPLHQASIAPILNVLFNFIPLLCSERGIHIWPLSGRSFTCLSLFKKHTLSSVRAMAGRTSIL